jgi:hypothetical protein
MVRLAIIGVAVVVAACADRPATEAVARFSGALTALNTTADASLGAVAQYERRIAREGQALQFATARGASEIRRTAGAVSQRPDSTAAAAQALLAPSLAALAAYSEKLAFLSGDDALRDLTARTDALVQGISDGATSLQGALGATSLPAEQVQNGVAAGQAIARFASEQVLARALVPQVRRADADVQKFAVFLTEMIGSPTTRGVRRALVRDRQIDAVNWPTLLVGVAGDRSVGVLGRRQLFLDGAAALETGPADEALAEISVAVARMAAAHAALVEPTSPSTRAKIEDFVSAVRSLSETYQRLRRAT